MDIIFKGRHTEVQERFRKHASAKLGKIEKLDHRAIRVDVEVSAERNPRQSDRRERVELTIRSLGPVLRAEAAADDRFTALDRALAKLEERLRRTADRRKAARHGTAQPARLAGRAPADAEGGPGRPAGRRRWRQAPAGRAGAGAPAGPAGAGSQDVPGGAGSQDGPGGAGSQAAAGARDGIVPIEMEGDGPVVVREKCHTAQPMSVDAALLAMELVGHDFYLFRDEHCGLPSVVYRRHGYQYGLIRLVEEASADGPVRPGKGPDGRETVPGPRPAVAPG